MEFLRLELSTRRAGLGLAILGVHAVVIALLARASLRPPELLEATALSVSLVQPLQQSRSPAPLPAPRLTQVEVAAVLPDVTVQLPPAPTAIAVIDAAPHLPAPHSAGPAAASEPMVISEVAYLRPPQPRYPAESRHAHEEGLVVVRVLIDSGGHARQVTVVHSSGHPRLDAAACEAVAQALFKPHFADGVPRDTLATVPVEFSLHRV